MGCDGCECDGCECDGCEYDGCECDVMVVSGMRWLSGMVVSVM